MEFHTKIMPRFKIVLMLLMLYSVNIWAESQEMQNLVQMKESISSFVLNDIANRQLDAEIVVGNIDSRLRLAKCSGEIEVFYPNRKNLGATTVAAKCISPGWKIFIPVQIINYSIAVVANRPLPRGHTIKSADLEEQRIRVSTVHGSFLTATSQAVGMKLKKSLRQGDIIKPTWLTTPMVINKGDNVTIIAKNSSITVRMSGKALEKGAIGDRIQVINIKSKQEVEGVVVSKGVVEVDI